MMLTIDFRNALMLCFITGTLFGYMLFHILRELYYFSQEKKKNTFIWGIGNKCRRGYVLFLDYDGVPYEWIKDEIQYLQEKFFVGDCYIFKTKRGFHVINPEVRPLPEIVNLLRNTTADQDYKDLPLKFGKKVWVLRGQDKQEETIKYIALLKGKNQYVCSTPHLLYMQDRYHVPEKDLAGCEEDNEQDLLFASYYIPRAKN